MREPSLPFLIPHSSFLIRVIFFGIDPGTATTGYGVVEMEGTRRFHVAHGVIRTPYGQPAQERLRRLSEALSGLFVRFNPQIAAMEELYFSTNVRTAIAVAQAQGVVLLAAAHAGLRLMEFAPNQVKQAVTGNGRAGKSEVQTMVKTLLGLPEIPRPDDAADALAIALCATQEPAWLPAARDAAYR